MAYDKNGISENIKSVQFHAVKVPGFLVWMGHAGHWFIGRTSGETTIT